MQQQQGGSQYGVPPPPPDMTPFSPPRAHMLGISHPDPLQQQAPPQPQLAEAASPISSRPPPPGTALRLPTSNFEELAPAVPGNFPDDEALVAAGEEVERGAATGNRWPRQETLALLKIRSEMDAAFRDATLKGPLWEDVSRRLAELGYRRSAKKCKEKFENVHKYYKRTKEGRAGRQDGKSYRFFSQLEALHSSSSSSAAAPAPAATAPALTTAAAAANPTPTTPIGISTAVAGPSSARIQPPPVSAVAPPPITMTARELAPAIGVIPSGISGSATAIAAGISFSSNTSSSSSSESDDEETEEACGSREGRKRKHSGSGSSRKMMAFFEGMMRQVMERQESMQQRFLETIEKREQDRMIREEAWRRQEVARLNREHELLAQERAMAASRDAAIISCIQKISGQTIQIPTVPATVVHASSVAPPPAPPPQQSQQPQPQHQQQQQQRPSTQMQPSQPQQEFQQHNQSTEIGRHQVSTSSELVPVPDQQEPVGTVSFEPASSSRWPKAEVHALIKMRSGLESRYQESGPKGPLWEEISAGMQRLGYNRSAKRCKEKWENINKYFKKVKESNKKRPEDSKTCPYFHQLDALYRKKHLGSGGGIQRQQEQETDPNLKPQERSDLPIAMAPPPQQPSAETETKNGNNNNNNGNGNNNNNNRNGVNSEVGGGSGTVQIQTSNGGLPSSFFEEGSSAGGMTMKKPEDIVKELMDQRQQQPTMDDYDKMEEPDSDNIDQDDDDDDDEDDEDGKMQYKIQFQRPKVGGGEGTTSTAAPTAGSFLAMVQ